MTDPGRVIEQLSSMEQQLNLVKNQAVQAAFDKEKKLDSAIQGLQRQMDETNRQIQTQYEQIEKIQREETNRRNAEMQAAQNSGGGGGGGGGKTGRLTAVSSDSARKSAEAEKGILEAQQKIGKLEKRQQSLTEQMKKLTDQKIAYRKAVAQHITQIAKQVPRAQGYLRQRIQALKDFERPLGSLPDERRPGSGASGGAGQAQGRAETLVSTVVSAVLPTVFATVNANGGHKEKYRKARDEWLRTRVLTDPNQPRFVRGWIKNELRRSAEIRRARVEGREVSGSVDYIRTPPGYHVGHRYPDLDIPDNFRLELISMNCARPGIARRLGVKDYR
jgi:chromosome segregation ATPase